MGPPYVYLGGRSTGSNHQMNFSLLKNLTCRIIGPHSMQRPRNPTPKYYGKQAKHNSKLRVDQHREASGNNAQHATLEHACCDIGPIIFCLRFTRSLFVFIF